MLRSMGTSDVVADFISISNYLRDEGTNNQSHSFDSLKESYVNYVSEGYPESSSHSHIIRGKPYKLVDDPSFAKSLMACYNNDSMLDDLAQSNAISDDFDYSLLSVAESYCSEIDYMADAAPEFKAAFDLAVNYLLILPSSIASGGSSSALPGVIWINPKYHWDTLDKRELLVHELSHNLLFIDEIVHGLFIYDGMADKEQWCYSAVLGKSRPLDKAYHSAIVATEILLHREALNEHPNTPHAHPTHTHQQRNYYHK